MQTNNQLLKTSTLGLTKGTVKLSTDSSQWASKFVEFQVELLSIFGLGIITIDHIGSTSIPDLVAKPIIDIAVIVEDLQDYSYYEEKLKGLNYFYRSNGSREDRILFAKGEESNRLAYVSFTYTNSKFWQESVLFRDFLLQNPDYKAKYTTLKAELAEKYSQDRYTYTAKKAQFIQECLQKALEIKGLV